LGLMLPLPFALRQAFQQGQKFLLLWSVARLDMSGVK
jgi:hypothetical protein